MDILAKGLFSVPSALSPLAFGTIVAALSAAFVGAPLVRAQLLSLPREGDLRGRLRAAKV